VQHGHSLGLSPDYTVATALRLPPTQTPIMQHTLPLLPVPVSTGSTIRLRVKLVTFLSVPRSVASPLHSIRLSGPFCVPPKPWVPCSPNGRRRWEAANSTSIFRTPFLPMILLRAIA